MTRCAKMAIALVFTALLGNVTVSDGAVRGYYMEARTCQVYTGPCFANGEYGLTGKDAVMAWSISEGKRQDVDLKGLNVVVVVKASDTLAFQGLNSAETIQSMILVDKRATSEQRKALVDFAKEQSGNAGKDVKRIVSAPIKMDFDVADLTGNLTAGKHVQLATRKARPDDCICSNESAYYPPLAKLESFVPGVAINGQVSGRGLGSTWSVVNDRSAYLATFDSSK